MQVLLSTKLAHFISVIHSLTPVPVFVAGFWRYLKPCIIPTVKAKAWSKSTDKKAPMSPRRRILITATIVAAVCVAGVATTGWLLYGHQPILPRATISQVEFTVYVPAKLPAGFQLDGRQATSSSTMLTYTLTHTGSGKTVTVTQQATPANFNMNTLIASSSIPTTMVSAGSLYNLSTGDKNTYMLDAGGTLLFLTAPKGIEPADISAIATSMQKL